MPSTEYRRYLPRFSTIVSKMKGLARETLSTRCIEYLIAYLVRHSLIIQTPAYKLSFMVISKMTILQEGQDAEVVVRRAGNQLGKPIGWRDREKLKPRSSLEVEIRWRNGINSEIQKPIKSTCADKLGKSTIQEGDRRSVRKLSRIPALSVNSIKEDYMIRTY
jgi:hypothetical protein